MLIGTSVFPAWERERSDFGAVPNVMSGRLSQWDSLKTTDRVPAIGVYDEADPIVTIWRLTQMEKAGLNYCTYQIEWAHEHTQPSMLPSWRKKLASPLTVAHCADNHPSNSLIKYALSLWDVSAYDDIWKEMRVNGWKAVHVEESWRLFARTVATRHMMKSSYLHIKNRPVLFRGAAENLDVYNYTFGVTPKRIIDIIREEVLAVTGKELYLVATATDPAFYPQLKGIGFDCKTQYLLHGDGWANAVGSYHYWWARDLAFCREQKLDYIVPTSCGYNASAWPESEQHTAVPTPAQFILHLKEAIKLVQDNADVCVGMLNYAWSEFGEGGILEPQMPRMLHDGDEMILAHRKALGLPDLEGNMTIAQDVEDLKKIVGFDYMNGPQLVGNTHEEKLADFQRFLIPTNELSNGDYNVGVMLKLLNFILKDQRDEINTLKADIAALKLQVSTSVSVPPATTNVGVANQVEMINPNTGMRHAIFQSWNDDGFRAIFNWLFPPVNGSTLSVPSVGQLAMSMETELALGFLAVPPKNTVKGPFDWPNTAGKNLKIYPNGYKPLREDGQTGDQATEYVTIASCGPGRSLEWSVSDLPDNNASIYRPKFRIRGHGGPNPNELWAGGGWCTVGVTTINGVRVLCAL